MENRLKNKNMDNPDVWTAIQHLQKAIAAGGVDPKLLAPTSMRASACWPPKLPICTRCWTSAAPRG
ncbi:hypothetical protein ACWET9_45985 [Streptomyces sp. NPDC004059]